jgi:uncharacterized DUF497 family protein
LGYKQKPVKYRKARSAIQRSGTVFKDNAAVIIDDIEHSQNEERFKIIGYSGNLRLLMVCYCDRDDDSVIRILSARKATKKEKIQYREGIK